MFDRNFYVDLVNAEFARQLPAAINPAALNAKEPRILRAIESWLEANPSTSMDFWRNPIRARLSVAICLSGSREGLHSVGMPT
jgi:hypothetical protein